MSKQDIEHCTICDGLLGFTPRLGDWIRHERCHAAVMALLGEQSRAARDAERDRIADHLELRASKLEDELAISETSTEIGLERILAVIKSLRREAMALRDNEHRSDT